MDIPVATGLYQLDYHGTPVPFWVETAYFINNTIAKADAEPGTTWATLRDPSEYVWFGKAGESGGDPDERWVTLKPHGPDSDSYVHVKLRVHPQTGEGHVIGGPKSLRGLRLTKLKSKEELEQQKAERQAERQQKKAEADAARTPEEAAERAATLQRMQADVETARQRTIEAAQALTGDERWEALTDDDLLDKLRAAAEGGVAEAPGEDAEVAHETARRLAGAKARGMRGAVTALVHNVLSTLAADNDLKDLVLTAEDSIDPSDLPGAELTPSGSRGYAFGAEADAAKQGFTTEDAQKEADAFTEERIATVRATDPERAAKMEKGYRDRKKAREVYAPKVRAALVDAGQKPDVDIKPSTLTEKAKLARELLLAHRQQRAMEAELRKYKLGKDPDALDSEQQALRRMTKDPKGTPWGMAWTDADPAAMDSIANDIENAAAEDLTRSFLASLETEPDLEWDYAAMRRAMQGPHATGAYATLNNAALTMLGTDALDRPTVDALGVEASARLIAYAMRRDMSPEELEHAKEALGGYHHDVSLGVMQAAIETAEAARADAIDMDIPPITSSTDAVMVQQLLNEKKDRLREAHTALGTALGQIESGSALNMALMQAAPDELEVNMGEVPVERAALNLRALGLKDGDYAWSDRDGSLWATITKAGMDRLTPGGNQDEIILSQRLAAIKRGDEDEDNWLPDGFAQYSSAAFDENPPMPENFAANPGFDVTTSAHDALSTIIGSRLADGWSAQELVKLLTRQDFINDVVPMEQRDAYEAARRELLPITAHSYQVVARNGTLINRQAYLNYADLDKLADRADGRVPPELTPEQTAAMEKDAYNRYQRARADAITQEAAKRVRDNLTRIADDWIQQNRPDGGAYADQQLDTTSPEGQQNTYRALNMALTVDPRTQVAFRPLGELKAQDQAALRDYFRTELRGVNASEYQDMQSKAAKAEADFVAAHPEPAKFDFQVGLGGQERPVTIRLGNGWTDRERDAIMRSMNLDKPDMVYHNDDGSVTLTAAGRAAIRPPKATWLKEERVEAGRKDIIGLEMLSSQWRDWHKDREAAINDASGIDKIPDWDEFITAAGGRAQAYESIQDHMRSAFVKRFADAHANMTGKALKLGRRGIGNAEALLAVTNPEMVQELKEERARALARVRERDRSGQYAQETESLTDKAARERQQAEAARLAQGGLAFGPSGDSASGTTRDELRPGEMNTLPPGIENRLSMLLAHITPNIEATDSPTKLIPNLTMGKGTKYVKQQRAIKAIVEGKKQAAFLGVGSGKTNVAIGGFTALHAKGEARKGLFIVPSIVRNQFGEAMAQALEPGKFNWHAQEAPFAERVAAYKDPDTHMVSVTHQSFRDDMLKLMAQHHGYDDVNKFTDTFMAAKPEERERLLKAMTDREGIPLDYMAMDEAHDALNRAGKAESILSAVLDTAFHLSKYGVLATGSPVKNDPTEIGDWLQKLDPVKFSDQEAWRRQYAVDVHASREALKRQMSRYIYHDAITPEIDRKITWGSKDGAGDKSPSGGHLITLSDQQTANLARVQEMYQRARRAARNDDVDLEALKVLSPNSFADADAADEPAIAKGLTKALGTLRQSAVSRVVNEAPAKDNAKIQHVAQLADARRGKGGVVFARNRAAVEQLRQQLEKDGHRVATLTGSNSSEDKAKIRQAFNRGDVDIIVASDAGATGANLQHRGQWLVNYDLPLTHKTFEQRNGRIDRIGQNKSIELHHLMTDTKYDRANYDRLLRKKALGDIFQGSWESMDDTGLAQRMAMARGDQRQAVDLEPAPPAPAPSMAPRKEERSAEERQAAVMAAIQRDAELKEREEKEAIAAQEARERGEDYIPESAREIDPNQGGLF